MNAAFCPPFRYDYQPLRWLRGDASPLSLYTGQRVRIGCEYNSSARSTPAHFGGMASDEMCIAYFLSTQPVRLDGCQPD